MAEDCGLDAVAMHARTREQGYSGQAAMAVDRRAKSLVKIPVIGNGDMRSPEDARAMVAETGCDAVMIGRAAASNPWIFRQIAEHTATGTYTVASREDRYQMIRRYFSCWWRRVIPAHWPHEAVCQLVHPRRGGWRAAAQVHLRCTRGPSDSGRGGRFLPGSEAGEDAVAEGDATRPEERRA